MNFLFVILIFVCIAIIVKFFGDKYEKSEFFKKSGGPWRGY